MPYKYTFILSYTNTEAKHVGTFYFVEIYNETYNIDLSPKTFFDLHYILKLHKLCVNIYNNRQSINITSINPAIIFESYFHLQNINTKSIKKITVKEIPPPLCTPRACNPISPIFFLSHVVN